MSERLDLTFTARSGNVLTVEYDNAPTPPGGRDFPARWVREPTAEDFRDFHDFGTRELDVQMARATFTMKQ